MKEKETIINTDDNSIIEFSTGRHSGERTSHFFRLVAGETRVVPVDVESTDLDIEFESNMPVHGCRYLISQAGMISIINKRIVLEDETGTLFIQTQIQSEPPTMEQAIELAEIFNSKLQDSDKYLFSFTGENTHGVIGYCEETQKSFVAHTTSKEPIIITCK